MAARTIRVTSLEVLPQLNSFDDVVLEAKWKYEEGSVSLACDTQFEAPAAGSDFVPLDSVTPEIAKSWVLSRLDDETMKLLNEAMDRKIASINNKPFVYDWSPEIVDDGSDPEVA